LRAAELLGLLQDTDAAQPLLKIFRDPAENLLIPETDRLSLARLGHKEILPEVLVLARNDEASGLSHVIRALGALGARDHAKLLMAPLAEAVDEVQLATVDALEQMGAVDQLDALIFKDGRPEQPGRRARGGMALPPGPQGRLQSPGSIERDPGRPQTRSGCRPPGNSSKP